MRLISHSGEKMRQIKTKKVPENLQDCNSLYCNECYFDRIYFDTPCQRRILFKNRIINDNEINLFCKVILKEDYNDNKPIN